MASDKPAHRFDPNFTDQVINGMGPKTSPRHRQVFSALIRHLHDFAREVELTIDEWQAGVKFINSLGEIYVQSNKTRNETHRICDILGFESYVTPNQVLHLPEQPQTNSHLPASSMRSRTRSSPRRVSTPPPRPSWVPSGPPTPPSVLLAARSSKTACRPTGAWSRCTA
jgi:hypothetical protein